MKARKKFLQTAILIFIMIFLLIALVDSYCKAEPFLVYDPNPPIEIYEVEIDGGTPIQVPPAMISEQDYQLVYDLVDLPVGAHQIRARAKYVDWGWNAWSEPFNINRPGPLENPQITTNPQLPLQ
jgi:hypothetical protein